MGRPRKVIGSERRADPEPAPVQQTWGTDRIEGENPDFRYQYVSDHLVRGKTFAKSVLNRTTGQMERVNGWTVCSEGDDQGLRQLGERPDVGLPIDGSLRQGPHVLMKIPVRDWELLQHESDATADATEERILRGGFDSGEMNRVVDGSRVGSVAKIVHAPGVTHPAMEGEQGARSYSPDEARLIGKTGVAAPIHQQGA